MKRISSIAASTAFTLASLTAAEPMVEGQITDVQRTRDRFNASVWGDVKKNEFIQSQLEEGRAEALAEGIDIKALAAAYAWSSLKVYDFSIENEQVNFQLNAALGDFAPAIFTLLKNEEGSEATTVEGADEAMRGIEEPWLVAARFGSTLSLGHEANIATPWPVEIEDSDVSLSVDLPAIITKFNSFLSASGDATLPLGLYPKMDIKVSVVDQGFEETWDMIGNLSGVYAAVDNGLLATLPGDSLIMMASGLNGPAMWEHGIYPSFAEAAKAEGKTAEEVMGQMDAMMTMMGLDFTLENLVKGLSGTFVLGVKEGFPFPAPYLIVPATSELGKVINLGLAQQGLAAPEVGSSVTVPLPNGMPLEIGVTSTHWVASTDAMFTKAFIGGTSSGYVESEAGKLALEKAGASAYSVASSNTKAIVKLLSGMTGMLGMMGATPDDQQKVMGILQTLDARVGTGYLISKPEGGNVRVEAKGLITPSCFIPMLVGFMD